MYRALADLAVEGEADSLSRRRARASTERARRANSTTARSAATAAEIEADAVKQWAKSVAAEHGFTQATHVVDVFGLCADCTGAAQ